MLIYILFTTFVNVNDTYLSKPPKLSRKYFPMTKVYLLKQWQWRPELVISTQYICLEDMKELLWRQKVPVYSMRVRYYYEPDPDDLVTDRTMFMMRTDAHLFAQRSTDKSGCLVNCVWLIIFHIVWQRRMWRILCSSGNSLDVITPCHFVKPVWVVLGV